MTQKTIDTDELEKLLSEVTIDTFAGDPYVIGLTEIRALIAKSPQADGMVLVPIVPNKEMSRVLNEEDWQWEDLLAAAEAITEEQYSMLSAYKPQSDDVRKDAWISVEDRLPDVDSEVLVNAETDDGDYVTSMRFDGKDFWHEGEQTYCHSWYCSPTHWQPLPAPPVDKARE